MRSNNESGYRGVYRAWLGSSKWCVRFRKQYYGSFDDPVEASRFYEQTRAAFRASEEGIRAREAYRTKRKGVPAWNKGLRRDPEATGSIAMQMLAQFKRRLLKGEQEGW